MRYELFKIISKDYAESLVNGSLYMNSLEYFRKIEGNIAQVDYAEGLCGTIPKNRMKQYGIDLGIASEYIVSDNIPLLNNFYGFYNIFCLYCLYIDDKNKKVYKPDLKLYNFNDSNEEKVVVHITDTNEFFNRIQKALNICVTENKIEYGVYGHVSYGNFWINADEPGSLCAFNKSDDYSYQSEWRLCVLKKTFDKEPFVFDIGSLKDIVEIISLKKFVTEIESVYPDYTIESKNSVSFKEPYHITGTLNSTSKLMFSYSRMPYNTPDRSDIAQADWHYMQYLALCGRNAEIDEYLEKQFYKYKDKEHFDLLVDYRLSINKWVKATDVFAYCFDNAQNIISENPNEFCFKLHTIFMNNKMPCEAAKFYYIADKRYDIDDDLKNVIQSDFLFALKFYDKAIEIYKKMLNQNSDPIIDFYLAVSYFYLLNFEKAEYHLNKYKEFFSSSPDASKNINRLSNLINIFKYKNPIKPNEKIAEFPEEDWNNELDNILLKNVDELLLGFKYICCITEHNKWYKLNLFNKVFICTSSISEIIDLYLNCGYPVLYNAIENIMMQKNIFIVSPNLEYYLVTSMENQDLPEFVIMEYALKNAMQTDLSALHSVSAVCRQYSKLSLI